MESNPGQKTFSFQFVKMCNSTFVVGLLVTIKDAGFGNSNTQLENLV
jgi:hypothetical protein